MYKRQVSNMVLECKAPVNIMLDTTGSNEEFPSNTKMCIRDRRMGDAVYRVLPGEQPRGQRMEAPVMRCVVRWREKSCFLRRETEKT